MHFDAIGRVPGDPILGLMEAYSADSNPSKFDLGVGVYKDAQGLTPILESVKQAERRLVDQQTTKTYIGGHGDAGFGRSSLRSSWVPTPGRSPNNAPVPPRPRAAPARCA